MVNDFNKIIIYELFFINIKEYFNGFKIPLDKIKINLRFIFILHFDIFLDP